MAEQSYFQTNTHPSDKDFRVGFRISIFFHLSLAALLFIKALVFPSRNVPILPTLRVDLVGLPDVLKKDLHKIPKTLDVDQITEALKKAETEARKIKPVTLPAKEKEAVADPDELVYKSESKTDKQKREKKLKNAIARIKALTNVANDLEAQSSNANSRFLVKGNKISKGSSLSPDARESGEANYYDILREHLQSNWTLPVWLARQNLGAQVQVFLNSRGFLHSFNFTKSSGNSQFDEAVKRTLTQSQPYPLPPKEIASALLSRGIMVGFPL